MLYVTKICNMFLEIETTTFTPVVPTSTATPPPPPPATTTETPGKWHSSPAGSCHCID